MTTRKRRLLGTQFLKLDTPGQTFQGTLVGRDAINLGGNSTYRYTLEADGATYRMNGTDQLDDALADAELGTEVEIKFIGLERTLNGYEVKKYEVSALEYTEDEPQAP